MNLADLTNAVSSAGFALALSLAAGDMAWQPAMPPRVNEMCVEAPIPDESLCNVEESLREPFLLVERAVAESNGALPESLTSIVRERQLSVEWYPAADPAAARNGLMGVYNERLRQVQVMPGLRPEPARTQAAVIAHELGHAVILREDAARPARPADACLEDEIRAYKIGLRAYEITLRLTGGEPAVTLIDQKLSEDVAMWRKFSGGDQLTDTGLDDLTNRHIFLHGYTSHCNWR